MTQQNQLLTKKCPLCAEEILVDAVKCRHCGEWQQNSNTQTVEYFVLLYIVSFGLYSVYWFYKNWKFIKELDKSDLSPFWRAFFSLVFAFSLFERIFALSKEKGYKENPSAGVLAVVFAFTLLIPLQFSDSYSSILRLLSFAPLVPAVNALNFYWRQEQPNLNETTKFSREEIILMVIGVILWIYMLLYS